MGGRKSPFNEPSLTAPFSTKREGKEPQGSLGKCPSVLGCLHCAWQSFPIFFSFFVFWVNLAMLRDFSRLCTQKLTPGNGQGTTWDTGDRTWVSRKQGKSPTTRLSLWSLIFYFQSIPCHFQVTALKILTEL